jgi:phosphoribosylformimino-5-aminoimidazole carboxamide ribotide isomerase
MRATDLARKFADAGVEAIICTDVGRDGTLGGVNVEFTLEIARACNIPTIASGGVKDDRDIEALMATGEIAGAIVGKAFYEGRIELKRFF